MSAVGRVAMLVSALVVTSSVLAGPPPYPEDLAEPNILMPKMTIGGYGKELGQFNEPHGIDFNVDGRIAIVDRHNDRVCILNSGYRVTACLQDPRNPLKAPTVAKWMSADRLAVADTGNGRVVILNPGGAVVSESDAGLLSEPTGVALIGDRIYVSDLSGQKITIFDDNLRQVDTFGHPGNGKGEFINPSSITSDGKDRLFVADSYNNRIQVFDRNGEFVNEFGDWGSFTGLLANPSSAFYANGLVFVTDLINHRIQVFDGKGDYAMQWGRHPVVNHEGNGRLHYPEQIAVRPDGEEAIVCEPFEHRCQVFNIVRDTQLVKVDDKAWWDKNGRFHYGARPTITPDMLAISEPDTHSVLIFDIRTDDVRFIGRVGGQGRQLGSLVKPSGVAIDPGTKTLFVSDSGNYRLASYDLTGALSESKKALKSEPQKLVRAVSTVDFARPIRAKASPLTAMSMDKEVADASEDHPIEPSALLFTKSGGILMADPANGRIFELDKQLNLQRTLVSDMDAELPRFRPNDLALSPDESRIYVVDFYNARIAVFDREGKYLFKFGSHGSDPGQFVHAFGLAVGQDGSVFVSDEALNRIAKFDRDGKYLRQWGSWGAAPGQFYKPKGIALDRATQRLVVADFGNHRAQIFDTDGNFRSTFGIGQGYVPFNLVQPTGLKAANEGGATPSNGGNFVINYRLSNPDLKIGASHNLDFSLLDFEGAKVDKAVRVSVSAMMPAHYHGLTQAPVIKQTASGWQASDIRFHMPGHWQIYFDIDNGIVTERAQIDVMVQ